MKVLLEYEVKRRQRADRKVTKDSRDEARSRLRTAKKKLDRKQAKEAQSRQLVVKGVHANTATARPSPTSESTTGTASSSSLSSGRNKKRTPSSSDGFSDSKYGDEPEHKAFPPSTPTATTTATVATVPAANHHHSHHHHHHHHQQGSNNNTTIAHGVTGDIGTPNQLSHRTPSVIGPIAAEDELLAIAARVSSSSTDSARSRRPAAIPTPTNHQ
jgi:hypothetical protein